MDDSDELHERARSRIGRVLKDKWTLDGVIGVGGMAAVYAATHRNGKRVAVKMLHPELSLVPSLRARFLREGYVANTVGHRGVVTIDDDDVTEDGSAFLVMELLEGSTLEARAEQAAKRMPAVEVLRYADDLLDVLAAAHEKGVVHRDIKPENVFVTREGVLKVLDFGIARVREVSAQPASATRSGAVLGTPAFMAPEQAKGRGEDIGAHTDIWAVGATMFTLLSGRWVHEADTVNEIMASTMLQHAPSIRTLLPTLSPAVVVVVDKALSREIDARYPNARAMQRAVRDAADALGSTGAAATQPFADRKPRIELGGPSVTHAPTLRAAAPPMSGEDPSSMVAGAVSAIPISKSATLTTSRGLAAEASPTPSEHGRESGRGPTWAIRAGAILLIAATGLVGVKMLGGRESSKASSGEVAMTPLPPDTVASTERTALSGAGTVTTGGVTVAPAPTASASASSPIPPPGTGRRPLGPTPHPTAPITPSSAPASSHPSSGLYDKRH